MDPSDSSQPVHVCKHEYMDEGMNVCMNGCMYVCMDAGLRDCMHVHHMYEYVYNQNHNITVTRCMFE